jgi:hypothetical protein
MKSQFLLDEAKASLTATIEDAASLSNSAVAIAGVFAAALGGCGSIILNKDAEVSLVAGAIVTGIYLSYHLHPLIRDGLRARAISHPGNLAENLLRPEYEKLELAMLVEIEARSYDSRIKSNAERNRKCGGALNTAMIRLTIAPGVFLAASLLARLISLAMDYRWS